MGYKTELQSNNTDLQGVLDTINALPNASTILDEAQEYTNTMLNRTTAVNVADTNYSTVMVRGISAGTTDLTAGTSALESGTIYVVYE